MPNPVSESGPSVEKEVNSGGVRFRTILPAGA
jgi:hypothetical protein